MKTKHTVIQMDDFAWRIEEESVRSFLFAGTERALLVDSGKDITNMKEVVRALTSLPVVLVNTHADFDHISCNAQFDEIFMHPSEFFMYRNVQGRRDNINPLWEGDVIDIGNRRFETILIPGHTPGSIALLDSDNRILIGGDSVQNGYIYLFGAERDLMAYKSSLKKLLHYVDLFDWIYPSHAQCPIGSGIIQGLVAGTSELLKGSFEGAPYFPGNQTVKAYDIGVAHILSEL